MFWASRQQLQTPPIANSIIFSFFSSARTSLKRNQLYSPRGFFHYLPRNRSRMLSCLKKS